MQVSIQKSATGKSIGTISDQIFELLQQQIVNGELRPNERLVELRIAKKLGFSRTPVREALKKLELTGYVITVSRGGLVVTDQSSGQIKDLLETREALETKAVKLACERATEKQLRKAEKYHIQSIDALNSHDIDQYVKFHGLFHEELCSTCGNNQLCSLIRIFRYQYFDRRLVRVFTSRDWKIQVKYDRKLLETVRKRNQDGAERALHRTFKNGLQVVSKRLL